MSLFSWLTYSLKRRVGAKVAKSFNPIAIDDLEVRFRDQTDKAKRYQAKVRVMSEKMPLSIDVILGRHFMERVGICMYSM